ncbi:hypothetical protein [Lacimicrobium sp. SS2-24]|uniref:hypothetical protein n=1 Tax=Lacimicrobium sp. SS2-24 TaxID=2005569 RepID=UPI000B4ADE3D|nr:hypothetical protein [Lacimicrobium sp. SS2-24]
MPEHNFDNTLEQQLRQLPKERQPQRDLWPGIEHALNAEIAPANGRKVSALVASVLAVGMLGWMSLSYIPASNPSQPLATVLSEQHQQQKAYLLATYADQPALTDNWQAQLKELDDAALVIKQALEQDPQNMALLKMLKQVHQQQIDLIERVHTPRYQQI